MLAYSICLPANESGHYLVLSNHRSLALARKRQQAKHNDKETVVVQVGYHPLKFAFISSNDAISVH